MVIYLSFLLIYDNFLIIAFPKLCCSYLDLSLDHELACPHSEIGIYLPWSGKTIHIHGITRITSFKKRKESYL